jgi:hypothetical protein
MGKHVHEFEKYVQAVGNTKLKCTSTKLERKKERVKL